VHDYGGELLLAKNHNSWYPDIHHIPLEINYFAEKFLEAWLKDMRSSAQVICTYTHTAHNTHRCDSVHAMHGYIL
jgi:hypothetical protein